MKIWTGYSSEHSMNLVLIGKFKQVKDAEAVADVIKKLGEQASKDDAYAIAHAPPEDQRFSDGMLALIRQFQLYTLAPEELGQFNFEHSVEQDDDTIKISTDEADVSAFIKLFVESGARVEVYSAHHYPDKPAEAD
jgi:Family of unknown function (DUF6375)